MKLYAAAFAAAKSVLFLSNGEIKEGWDLKDDEGNTVTNDTVKAVFNVTLLDPDSGSLAFLLHRVLSGEDGDFTIAYTWDQNYYANGTMKNAVQYGIVDPLISPLQIGGGGSETPYFSTFNDYSWSGGPGNPGYIPNMAAVGTLITNLADLDTMNFYFDGHGNPTTLGDGPRLQVAIFVNQVSWALGNRFSPTNGAWCQHPYRFVFLNACDTADDLGWAHAFGIPAVITPAQLADRPMAAQAFLGWIGEPRAPDSDSEWNDMAQTFTVFFEAWQYGYNLKQCIALASSKHPFGSGGPTLNFPFGKKFFQIFGVPAQGSANNFTMKVFGYPLIKREGYDMP